MPRSSRKMNTVFIFAALIAMVFAISASAQQPPARTPVPVSTVSSHPGSTPSWVSSRKINFDNVVQIGDAHVSKWSGIRTSIPVIGLGGDPAMLEKLLPTVACYYHDKLEVTFLADHPVQKGKVTVLLINGTLRELRKTDLNETDISELRRFYPEAAEKWQREELTMEALEVWIYKSTGLKPAWPEITEMTEEDWRRSLSGDKPLELVFYRTEENLEADASLTPETRKLVLTIQKRTLTDTARKAARYRPLLNVRKTATTTKFFGKNAYDQFAAGSWQGYPVGILVWGSPEIQLRQRWGPFSAAPPEGRLYPEDLEVKILSCLGIESLARTESKLLQGSTLTARPD